MMLQSHYSWHLTWTGPYRGQSKVCTITVHRGSSLWPTVSETDFIWPHTLNFHIGNVTLHMQRQLWLWMAQESCWGLNTLRTGDADLRFLHYSCARRMTQICVFNTLLFSLHNTLNYAIRGTCLQMVLLTDVYRNLTSLWIKPRERAFKQFKSPVLNVLR